MILNEANNNDREHLIAIIQMTTIIALVFASVFYGEMSKATLDSVNLITPMFGFYGLYGFYLKSKENNTKR